VDRDGKMEIPSIPSGTLDGKFSIQFYFPSKFHPYSIRGWKIGLKILKSAKINFVSEK
jgi:hypothetical protein